MLTRSLTNGRVAGSGTITIDTGVFGGALITTDGTNAAVVTVTDSDGKKIFDISTKTPGFISAPIMALSKDLAYSVTGTGAAAQFYEWIA